MRALRLLLIVLLAAPALHGAEVAATALPQATMSELAQTIVTEPVVPHVHRRSRSFMTGESFFAPELTPLPEVISAPAVTARFQDESDPSRTYPADAGGAVGPHHVVSVNNKAVSVRDRSGNQLLRTTITQFWHDANFPDGVIYDTRISYDATADRYVIAALYDRGDGTVSTVLFAATANGDPTGTWYRYRLRVDPSNASTADFTRLALTPTQAIITTNIYPAGAPDPSFAQVTTVPLSLLYSAATAPITTVTNSPNGVVDIAPVEVVNRNDTSSWVVRTTSAGLFAYDLAQGFAEVVYAAAPVPLTTEFLTKYGQQKDSGTLMDTGDMVVGNALIRDHMLWVVQSAEPQGVVRTSIVVWRYNIATSAMGFRLIDDPSGATTYAFPSLAVNRNGGVLVAYAQFNRAYYPSAGFTYVDPSSNATASTFLQQGEAPYNIDRWADFTTTVVDPVDDTGFWTVQVLPLKPTLLGQQVWSTWWFNIPLTTTPAKRRAARH